MVSRSSFTKVEAFKARKPREPGEFDAYTPKSRKIAKGSAELSAALEAIDRLPAEPTLNKIQGRAVQAIRDAANGEPCSLRYDGICNRDPATCVWAHWPGLAGDRGMGIKSIDIAGAVACSACHDALDGRSKHAMTRCEVLSGFLHGHLQSLVMLARKGIL